MSVIGTILLITLCLWTGIATISMLGWRKTSLLWQKNCHEWEGLHEKAAKLNKILLKDCEEYVSKIKEQDRELTGMELHVLELERQARESLQIAREAIAKSAESNS